MDRDPVCGKDVDASPPFAASYRNERFVFCSLECKRTFEQSPESYSDPATTFGPKEWLTRLLGANGLSAQQSTNVPSIEPPGGV
jgi:YHS domain-containing protein